MKKIGYICDISNPMYFIYNCLEYDTRKKISFIICPAVKIENHVHYKKIKFYFAKIYVENNKPNSCDNLSVSTQKA